MTRKQNHNFTPEKLQTFDRSMVETILANAERHEHHELIEMCRAELARRPAPMRVRRVQREHGEAEIVMGYHFVCSDDRGVQVEPNGTFWSGSWRVDEKHVKESIKYEAYLALHRQKEDASYRHGTILEYRRAPRDMIDKENQGIEFLVLPDSCPREWQGAGAGEKGYLWEKISRRPEVDGAE